MSLSQEQALAELQQIAFDLGQLLSKYDDTACSADLLLYAHKTLCLMSEQWVRRMATEDQA